MAVALALVRPLTLAVLAEGALAAALYLGFAVLGLVISLRRPDNPIGWLLAGSGLVWSLNGPGEAWTVEGFAARLRDQVDLDALHDELLVGVDQTMQPTRASLWPRPAPTGRP